MMPHNISIPQDIIDRLISRRGQLHVFGSLSASRTGLLVIDMQNAYLRIGAPAEIPKAREIVANINLLAAALRKLGSPIIWVQNTFAANAEDDWPSYFLLRHRDLGRSMREALSENRDGHELWHEMDVQTQDWRVKKYRYSALANPERNSLVTRLRCAGIEHLIIVGTATNICCESTARDAMMQNFLPIMISDATATRSDQEHMSALISVWLSFGDVYSTKEALECLRP